MGLMDRLRRQAIRGMLVDQLAAMLGPARGWQTALWELNSDKYLFGYMIGRTIGPITFMGDMPDSEMTKIFEGIIMAAYPSPYLDDNLLYKMYCLGTHDPDFERGAADAAKVCRYLAGADYSRDPDLAAAKASARHIRTIPKFLRMAGTNAEIQRLVCGFDRLYFAEPYANKFAAAREIEN